MENENSVTAEQTTEGTASHINDLKDKNNIENDEVTNGTTEENGVDHVDNIEENSKNEPTEVKEEVIKNKESNEKEEKSEEIIVKSNDEVDKPTISLSQINLNDEIPASRSAEFTYTTFGEVQVESSDESSQINSDKPKDETEKSDPVTAEPEKVEAEMKSIVPDKIEAKHSGDQKQLEINEFINKVKQNSITNQEVCNYMLNLLVSGEFDLEKNFVIQNVKSILHLIQVIKCSQPALKVCKTFIELIFFIGKLIIFNSRQNYGVFSRLYCERAN